MCFSATVSFISSAGLLSASAYILHKSRPIDLASAVSAAIPFTFSLQQALEGSIWLETSVMVLTTVFNTWTIVINAVITIALLWWAYKLGTTSRRTKSKR